MKDQDIIKAIAELDGYFYIWKWRIGAGDIPERYLELKLKTEGYNYDPQSKCQQLMNGKMGEETLATTEEVESIQAQDIVTYLPYYLYSRDAIIPVIEKWMPVEEMEKLRVWMSASQLCERLLRFTGKWIE